MPTPQQTPTRKCEKKNFLKRSGGLRLRSGYALPEPEAAAAPSLILIVAASHLDCRAAYCTTTAGGWFW